MVSEFKLGKMEQDMQGNGEETMLMVKENYKKLTERSMKASLKIACCMDTVSILKAMGTAMKDTGSTAATMEMEWKYLKMDQNMMVISDVVSAASE